MLKPSRDLFIQTSVKQYNLFLSLLVLFIFIFTSLFNDTIMFELSRGNLKKI